MQKFTVFTVILTLVVVISATQVVANRYWPSLDLAFITGNEVIGDGTNPLPNSLNLSANILGTDVAEVDSANLGLDTSTLPPIEFGDGLDVPTGSGDINGLDIPDLPISTNQDISIPDLVENISTDSPNSSENSPISTPSSSEDSPSEGLSDFESNDFKPAILNVYLNQDQLKSAGFMNTTLDTETFDGFLYKTIYVQDLKDLKIFKNIIKSPDTILCKVYIIDVGPMNVAQDVYEALKARGSEGLDIDINETSEFGDGSFYMNDSRRQNVAFLTVRFGNLIYGFSYPKEYHPQVKNLVKLLDIEF